MKNKELAKAIIIAYLSSNDNGDFTPEGLITMWEIKNGNDDLLLEHIKALKNIFEKAIGEIEGNKKDDWSEAMCGGLNNANN